MPMVIGTFFVFTAPKKCRPNSLSRCGADRRSDGVDTSDARMISYIASKNAS
jgi:hypothetical protein